MARPGGNPDFGRKYSFVTNGDEPLSRKQLQIRLPQRNYDELMKLPRHERLELVRSAIARALSERQEKAAAAG